MLINKANVLGGPEATRPFPMYRSHRVWIAIAVAVTVLGALWYFLASARAGRLLGGSSLPGFVLGVLGGLIILFEFLLGWRKSVRTWRIGKVKHWMAGHVWLGLACVPLLVLHCGIYPWGGELTVILMILLFVVVFSGVYGLWVQQVVPKKMLEEVPAETIFNQIPRIAELNTREADNLILAICGPPEASIGADGAQSTNEAGYLVVSQMRMEGRVQGRSVQTRAPGAPVPDSEPLRTLYRAVVRDYLARGARSRSPLTRSARAEVIFVEIKTKLPPDAHEAVDRLKDFCDQRRQLDHQARLHRRMHDWLWIHLPLSAALVILMFMHIYYALRYW